MQVPCPNCKNRIEMRGMARKNAGPDGNDAWICMWCQTVICICCYGRHAEKHHDKWAPKKKGE